MVMAGPAAFGRDVMAAAVRAAGVAVELLDDDPAGLAGAVGRTHPEVLVADLRGPAAYRAAMVAASTGLRRDHPGLGLIFLADRPDPAHLSALLAVGPGGIAYLVEEHLDGLSAFLAAARAVAAGQCVLTPLPASSSGPATVTVSGGRRGAVVSAPAGRPGTVGALSEREREVLALMAAGRSNRAISDQLFLTAKTVETHVRHIFTRLDLEPTPDDHRRVLAVLAYLHGQDLMSPAGRR
jgi:DNA-binding NarL/FixJ family response regulator